MTGKPSGQLRKTALIILLACLAAMFPAVTAASGESGSLTREERLALAREKYNENTVNVYRRERGRNQRGKINVCFYYSRTLKHTFINIRESLQITDETEMQAVLEIVVQNENFAAEDFGTISFMKAQWIAHNIAHSMATGSEAEQRLAELIAGESIRSVISRAEELDLTPREMIPGPEQLLYEAIELVYGRQWATDGN